MNYIRAKLFSNSLMLYEEIPSSNEFLMMYRQFLKLIPLRYDRKLERIQKLREAQWIFRELKDECKQDTIQYYKKLGYQYLKKIENKEPIPTFYPNPLDLSDPEFEGTFNRRLFNDINA